MNVAGEILPGVHRLGPALVNRIRALSLAQEWVVERDEGTLDEGVSELKTVKLVAHLRISCWLAALGVLVLYVFFISLATISPAEVAGVTAVMAVLATLLAIRGIRVNSELADPGGDPRTRRALNRQRERRGF